ncbi:MAG: hypothetical protein V7750_16470 [Sneathiella sp.]
MNQNVKTAFYSAFLFLFAMTSVAQSAEVADGAKRISGDEIAKITSDHSWISEKFSIYHSSPEKRTVYFGSKEKTTKHWVENGEYCAESIRGGTVCAEVYKKPNGHFQVLVAKTGKLFNVEVLKGKQ